MTRERQSGYIFMVSVAVVGMLVAVFGYMIQNSYRRTMQAELQAAADAAAHAGARSLSSSIAGYAAARPAAAAELAKHVIHRGFGRDTKLPPLDPSTGPSWESPDEYSISIVRGAWWPDGAPDTNGDGQPGNGFGDKFFSFENLSGDPQPASDIAPSLPGFLAANAVQVKITLKKARGPFSFLGELDVSAQATAVGGALGEVTTAPFAIPACSLLTGAGDYNPQTRCGSDIYFTRRDRYCPPENPRCGVKPGFFAIPDQPEPSNTVISFKEQCSFATESIDSDYLYGFVVGPDDLTTEAMMRGNDFRLMTRIGGRVTILEEGFTEAATGEWMYSLMQSGSRTTSTMSNERGIGGGVYTVVSKKPSGVCDVEDLGYGACNTTGFRHDIDNWVSNSFNSCSVAYVLAAPDYEVIQPNFGEYWPARWESEAFQHVWTAKASVVVWSGMGDCAGINGSAEDPLPPPPGTELRVIGFVDIDVYGADVGVSPPKPPDTIYSKGHSYWRDEEWMCRSCDRLCDMDDSCRSECGAPINCGNDCNEAEGVPCRLCREECGTDEYCLMNCGDCDQRVSDCVAGCSRCQSECDDYSSCIRSCEEDQARSCTYKNPHSCDIDGPSGPIPNEMVASHSPWGFSPPVAASEPDFKCNLVRARTHCQDQFVPAIQNGQARDIIIVQ